jgi:alkylation response protein AidB-like acyl-CoA dehydrogenase
MCAFFQTPPELGNPYREDPLLGELLAWRLPGETFAAVAPGLDRLGERARGEMLALAREAERDPPRHLPFDAWGRRQDLIAVSPAWRRLQDIAAEEGVVAAAYDHELGPWARLHQVARLYLYHPSSAIASCPLAMTDGAARTLLRFGSAEQQARLLPHLLSRDPESFWTAGQWMTERTGGSDVSTTETVARRDTTGAWRLWGSKWFTSATTAEVALTLARPEGAPAGSAGLSLFLVEPGERSPEPPHPLQGIRVLRLKDKLGTRALPTAELELEGTPAEPVGELGHGVRKIAAVLNVTRLYNACCSAASLARCLLLARSYAERRFAFGRRLLEHPLHVETLAALALDHAAATHLVTDLAVRCGAVECGQAGGDDEVLLRLLTPVAKLWTAKLAVAGASETLEAFGGAGYVEDTGLPVLLRDAQVLSIWEGTTNVLALDTLRAIAREAPWAQVTDLVARRLAALPPDLDRLASRVGAAFDGLGLVLEQSDEETLQAAARTLAFGIARSYVGLLLLEHWAAAPSPLTETRARRWCASELAPLPFVDAAHRTGSRRLLGAAAEESRAGSSARRGA